jgi:hypothetical protein
MGRRLAFIYKPTPFEDSPLALLESSKGKQESNRRAVARCSPSFWRKPSDWLPSASADVTSLRAIIAGCRYLVPVRPVFNGTVPTLWVLNSSGPVSCRVRFGTPTAQGFSESIKYYISKNTYEHFYFPTMGEDIYRSRTAINRPLTGRNRRGRGKCVD